MTGQSHRIEDPEVQELGCLAGSQHSWRNGQGRHHSLYPLGALSDQVATPPNAHRTAVLSPSTP